MNSYRPILKVNLESILQYLLMMIIIAYGQSVWIRIKTNIGISMYDVLCIMAGAVLIVLLLLNRKIPKNGVIAAIILAFLFVFYTAISNRSLFYTVILRIILPLSLFVIYLQTAIVHGNILNFIKKYSDIVCTLSAISLVLYLFGTVLNILPSQTITYNWAGELKTCKTYFYFLFETQTEDFFGITFTRNCGIFAEAPSYAVPLILSLYIEWFVCEKLSKFRFVVLILTIVTSFSAKALMILCIMVALKVLQVAFINKSKKKYVQIIRILIPVVIVCSMYAMLLILDQKRDSYSYISRIDNINSTLMAFFDHPFFGVGLWNEAAVSAYSALTYGWQGFSMGATLILAEGGLYITAIYAASVITAFRRVQNKWIVISLVVVYFALLFTSNIPFFLTTLFVLALGFSIPPRNMKKIT